MPGATLLLLALVQDLELPQLDARSLEAKPGRCVVELRGR